MPTYSEAVRSSSTDLSLEEILQQPVTELIGVGPEEADALEALAVETIFDLGSSWVFAQASSVLAAASSGVGDLASDVLDEGALDVPIAEAADLPIRTLRAVPDAEATNLSSKLNVETIRELSLWPPRRVAHEMVSVATGTSLGDLDEDTAEELRPRLGEYPTERVYYDTLLMLGTEPSDSQTPMSGPLSLDKLTDPGVGFGAPAVGALATYSQSWFAQGVTLGHMTHSLALAPGEATRIAVIDWSRRTSATAAEEIQEREQLDNAMTHARAASEVQNAVADEMQRGGSISTGWAKSTSESSGMAGSIGGGIAGTVGKATGVLGFGFGGSKSSQESETESRATSTSWSVGSRSVVAGMQQRVNDRTEQHATSVRNRRASAVREVSQDESEEVSTRIVANYNHMHALTVQYYEVVQIYRVTVELNSFERVVFLPFELLDFTGPDGPEIVARFRGELLDASLSARAADLLLDDQGRIEIRSAIRVPLPITIGSLDDANLTVAAARFSRGTSGVAAGDESEVADGTTAADEGPAGSPSRDVFKRARPGPVEEVLPGDAELLSVAFEGVEIERVRIQRAGVPADLSTFVVPAATGTVEFTDEVLMRQVERVSVARDADSRSDGSMVLRYSVDGQESIAEVPLSLGEGTGMQSVAYFAADAADREAELLAHLQANRGYYTTAILQNLDAASLVMMLSDVTWLGKPLADQVEPNPVAVAGNFLILRAPVETDGPSGLGDGQTWGDLVESRGVDFSEKDQRLVPIPTDGVFAEAVLGRSNSAEKLDITRFWNWQDSPIPMQPPEIAPVATGSRATSEDLTPGQLSAPVLNLMTPTQLPEPTGLEAALGALASAGMFRDMSGLAGTQAAAQAASEGTLDAATEAGRIASENYKAATKQATEMGKAAADMWKTVNTGGGDSGGDSGASSSAGISGDGARINQGKDLDRRGVSSSSGDMSTTEQPDLTEAVFRPGGDVMPPASDIFSREMAYSDEAAAVSPNLLGATNAALGGAPGSGGSGPTGSSIGTAIVDALQVLGEQLVLAIIESDCQTAGLSLQGVDLIPMRKHDNHAEFKSIDFSAWTNNSKHVYLNIEWFVDQVSQMISGGASADVAMRRARAIAVYVMRHEINHVNQFKANGDQPPATFADMIDFEFQAYGGDASWLQTQPVETFMLNHLGVTKSFVSNTLLNSANSTTNQFDQWRSLQTEQERKDALVGAKFLPATIQQGNKDYAIGELYQTKAP